MSTGKRIANTPPAIVKPPKEFKGPKGIGPYALAEPEGFDREKVRKILMKADGNITAAAGMLGCDPARLRAYVKAMEDLTDAVHETMEQAVDGSVAVLYEGLRDKESFQNRFYAAKEFLKTDVGRRRGFGNKEAPRVVEGRVETGTIVLKWIEPDPEPEEEGPEGMGSEGPKGIGSEVPEGEIGSSLPAPDSGEAP